MAIEYEKKFSPASVKKEGGCVYKDERSAGIHTLLKQKGR